MLKNADVIENFGLSEIFRKSLWLSNFGTSFSFLTSLLPILKGAGHLDPPVVPFSKKPSRNKVYGSWVPRESIFDDGTIQKAKCGIWIQLRLPVRALIIQPTWTAWNE